MTETMIVPPIVIRWTKGPQQVETVRQLLDVFTDLLRRHDDESLDGQRLLSWQGTLHPYSDSPVERLPEAERIKMIEVLRRFVSIE